MHYKSNLIIDPATNETLLLSELYKGNRIVVTPEQMEHYNMSPTSGVLKNLDGTYINLVEHILQMSNNSSNNNYIEYFGTNIKALNTIEGHTKDLVIRKRALENINPIDITNMTNLNLFNHNYYEVTVSKHSNYIQCIQNVSGRNCILGYDNKHNYKASTYYYMVADVEVIKTTTGARVSCGQSQKFKRNTIFSGRGLCCGVFLSPTPENIDSMNYRWFSIALDGASSLVSSGDGFKVYSWSCYEITEEEFNKGYEYCAKYYPVICNGTEVTGQYENGDITIMSSNKNLLKITDFETGDISAANGENVGHSQRSRTKQFIPVLSGTYTLSKNKAEWFFVGAYDINYNYIKSLIDVNSNKATFTISDNISYIRIRLNNPLNTLDSLELMLEENNIKTKYVKHEEDIKVIKNINEKFKLKSYNDITYFSSTNNIQADITVQVKTNILQSIKMLQDNNKKLFFDNKHLTAIQEEHNNELLTQADYIVDNDFRISMLELNIQ